MRRSHDADLAFRLRSARLEAGLSMREAAARLPKSSSLSHAAIANYERGLSQPTTDTLQHLADIYARPVSWLISGGPRLTGIRYRHRKSRLSVRERETFEATALRWVDAYARLEERLNARRRRNRPGIAERTLDPKRAAAQVRKSLRLEATQPIPSVIELLDLYAVYCLELDAPSAIDGLAAHYGTHHVVVLNPMVSNDRARMNAAHELGHLLYEDCLPSVESRASDREIEARAMDFASNLLMPTSVLRSALKGRSMVRLVEFKERYGVSLAAMVYRAEQEGLIPSTLAKRLWIEFAKRGWRRKEPGLVRRDRAMRFEQLLDGAIVRGELTWKEAAVVTCVREDELRARVQHALGYSDDYPDDSSDPELLRLV